MEPVEEATMRGKSWLRAGATVVFAVLTGCGGEAPDAPPAHPWLTAAPPPDARAEVLPAWVVYPVAPAALPEAMAELAAEPYIQISPGMATHYAGQEVRIPAAMRPFLVRAMDAPGAEVAVEQLQSGLWLRVRGGNPADLEAAPRVVLLDPTPRAIFVTAEPRQPASGAGDD
jgi:hypothetical protein